MEDTDGHNTDTIDALINVGPIVASMASSVKSSAEIKPVAWSMVRSLRKASNSVKPVVDNYVDLLYNVLTYRMSKDAQSIQQNVQSMQNEDNAAVESIDEKECNDN